jgi:hypothetical protein
MSSSSEKSKSAKPLFNAQVLVLTATIWGVMALLFFLLFSVSLPGEGRPLWYSIGTYILEQGAFLFAAFVCLRNGVSSQIVSGRNVWLNIGAGMACYFIGNLLFGLWELYWKLDVAVSPGDLFYILSYIFMSIGMFLAVKSRRLNLEWWQWGVTVVIATIGIAFAVWLSYPFEMGTTPEPTPSPTVQAEASPSPASPSPAASPQNGATPEAAPAEESAAADTDATSETEPPGWVLALETQLDPLGPPLNLAYVVLDVALLIIATLLLLAFWGGRFSQSWRMIAAAAFSLYIADMWFKYADRTIPDYESGDLLEVFWIFSGILFAIGAILEFDVSTRASRRGGRRRST